MAVSYWYSLYVFRPNGEADVTGDDLDVINEFMSMLLDGYSDEFDPKEYIYPDYFLEFVKGVKSDREGSNAGSSLSGLTILNE